VTFEDFRQTVSADSPPPGLTPALRALWHDGHGDWNEAHRIAQDIDDEIGAWIHAYLHRKEGDEGNAAYWYKRARKAIAKGSLEAEWSEIVNALLE
jgi:hypothetical protein